MEKPTEVVQHTAADGAKVGGLATCIDVWVASINFQAHRYKKYDDRDPVQAEKHGEEGQRLGKIWANALQRHSGAPLPIRSCAPYLLSLPYSLWPCSDCLLPKAEPILSPAGNTCSWFYPHWARPHYKENVLNGAGPPTETRSRGL